MTKRIKQLCSELKTELEKEKIKLAVFGRHLYLIDDSKKQWEYTNIKVDTTMQNTVHLDMPYY